nr:neurogenic locus notch homolog protein 2-like [Lytechinus pictus]
MENSPWKLISDSIGDTERFEVPQMYVLPWECDLTPPTIQTINSNSYKPSNHMRRTRQVQNSRATILQSEGGLCISYCQCRSRGSAIAFNIVLLATLVLIFTVVSLLVLALYQRSHFQIEANTPGLEPFDATTISDSLTGIPINSSKTPGFEPPEDSVHDFATSSRPESTNHAEAIATVLPTTPFEITQENGCVPIPIISCRRYLRYTTTFFPNRFGLGETASDGANLYYQFSFDIGTHCHPDAKRLLCRILFSTCYQPFILVDPAPLPCRSLCEDVGTRCVENRSFNETWNRICETMPESNSEDVCFRSSLTSNQDTHHLCSNSSCQNGGTCFEVNDHILCRCPDPFYGISCQNEFEDPCAVNPCLNGATCEKQLSPFGFSFYICLCALNYHGPKCEKVIGTSPDRDTSVAHHLPGTASNDVSVNCQVIPEECHSILSYNRSHGILVGSQTTFFSPWPLIETYVACSPSAARVLFCSTVYPTCSQDPQIAYGEVCKEVCERVKRDCEYSFEVLNLPYIDCKKLKNRNDSIGMPCLDSN